MGGKSCNVQECGGNISVVCYCIIDDIRRYSLLFHLPFCDSGVVADIYCLVSVGEESMCDALSRRLDDLCRISCLVPRSLELQRSSQSPDRRDAPLGQISAKLYLDLCLSKLSLVFDSLVSLSDTVVAILYEDLQRNSTLVRIF
jgi:hypothetical protein